jgi:hypothetical protein
MPPQQSHGLLDLFDERFGFGAHDGHFLNKWQADRSLNRARN